MGDERALDFGGAEAVAGDVEHVIEAADDPEIAVFVAARAVARGVNAAGVIRPVSGLVALLVAVNRADHGRPRLADDEAPVLAVFAFLARVIEDRGVDAEEGPRGGAGLAGRGSGQRGNQDRARFGLPPGVDDRASAAADVFVIPVPGFRVDRFSN